MSASLAFVAAVLLLVGASAEVGGQAPVSIKGSLAGQSDVLQESFAPAATGLVVVTETHTSAFQELEKKASEAMVGVLLIVLAFPVLWFNENRQAKMWALFGRARNIVKQNVSSENVDPANEACLVHMKGITANASELSDAQFGVAVSNCAALERKVQMFQWVETESKEEKDDNFGGKTTVTTYSYTQEWSDSPQDSANFQEAGHQNPPMPCEGQTFRAEAVSFGACSLSKSLIGKMCNFAELSQKELPAQISLVGGFSQGKQSVALRGSVYTTVGQGMSPEIGDVRISFTKVACGDATVLAVQHNNTFAPLRADMKIEGRKVVRPAGGDASLLDYSNTCEMLDQAEEQRDNLDLDSMGGCCSCCAIVGRLVESKEEVYMIAESQESAGTMFKRAQNEQAMIHTVLQIVGFLMLLFGWYAIFSLVPTLFRFIPFVGVFVQHVGNFLAGAVSFLLATVLWCITVALAWLAARPLKAGMFLCVAAVLIAVPWYLSNLPQQPHFA